jgi:hypothetical protein
LEAAGEGVEALQGTDIEEAGLFGEVVGEGGGAGVLTTVGLVVIGFGEEALAGVVEQGALDGLEAAGLPEVLDKALDELGFGGAGGLVVGEVVVEEAGVVVAVLDGGEGYEAIETMFEGVGADTGAAALGDGPGGS